MEKTLTEQEQKILLDIARSAIQSTIKGSQPVPMEEVLEKFDLKYIPPQLQKDGATFVTITKDDELRGCIGTLEAYQPLFEDVREHAIAAATQDYRFSPIGIEELSQIKIEISYLSEPEDFKYKDSQELLEKVRPNIDGVTFIDGQRRATFLPQVWDKLPNKEAFFDHLCLKMGVPINTWRKGKLLVQIYQVEEFHE
jgi:uncharacterized protein